MAIQNRKTNNAKKLHKAGILSNKASKRRDNDIEKYLKEKVEKDEIVLLNLVNEFKRRNPNRVVSFPIQYHYF